MKTIKLFCIILTGLVAAMAAVMAAAADIPISPPVPVDANIPAASPTAAPALGTSTNDTVVVRWTGTGPGAAAAADPDAVAALEAALPYMLQLAVKWPILSTILMFMGTLRLVMKPIVALLHKWVESTETKKDDEWLARVESSVMWKAVLFALDWFGSIKLTR